MAEAGGLTGGIGVTSAMKISVIIPTYRQWGFLQSCIDALANQSLPQDLFEVVIVNNDPADPAPETLRLMPNGRIVAEAAAGSYAARNRGITESRGDILCFTDADCLPTPDWLRQTLRCLEMEPSVARVGGEVIVTAPAASPDLGILHERLFGFNQARYVRRGGWAATANMTARRSVFDAVGLFDATIYSGGDHEWGKRAAAAGQAIRFCAEAVVDHPARQGAALLTRTRRIAGGALALELRSTSLWRLRLRMILSLPSRLFLPLPQIRRIVREPGLSATTRWRLFALCYRLRLVVTAERFRLCFLHATPERR